MDYWTLVRKYGMRPTTLMRGEEMYVTPPNRNPVSEVVRTSDPVDVDRTTWGEVVDRTFRATDGVEYTYSQETIRHHESEREMVNPNLYDTHESEISILTGETEGRISELLNYIEGYISVEMTGMAKTIDNHGGITTYEDELVEVVREKINRYLDWHKQEHGGKK